ncbi:condensation domain-containing protein, partial [Bacillus atrophaeus]
LDVYRDTSRNPLFDVMFALQNIGHENLMLEDLRLRSADIKHKVSKFDLTLYALEEPKGELRFHLEYNTDLYKKKTVEQWLKYLIHIFREITEDHSVTLGKINIVDEDETRLIIHEFNRTKMEYPRHETVSRLFERQAAKTPDAAAVVSHGQTLTYHELNNRANRIAAVLRAKGVGPESVVALLTKRTPELA